MSMRKPTVFINGRFLLQPISGVQRYAAEILAALDELLATDALPGANRYDWVVLAPRTAELPFSPRRMALQIVGTRADHLWDQTTLLAAARSGPLLSLTGSGPLIHPRHLVVIHDAAVYRHPEHFSRAYRLFHATAGRILARTARLGTVSRFSQRELAALLKVAPERIVVAPNGWEHLARLRPDATVVERLVGRNPFFVTVGNLTRNKNLRVAIEAFRKLPAGTAKLVVVGRADAKIFGDTPVPADDGVIFAGRLDDEALAALLGASRALVFPSLYEGFGIPPLEAMASGTRVLASRAEAIVEVCDGVADFFDATDAEGLATLMAGVLSEDAASRQLRIEAGRRRLELYSWSVSARILAEALTGQAQQGVAR
jgi:glycosyltransferase involved in cell wall biosynthesis